MPTDGFPAGFAYAIDQAYTKPGYLIEIGFATGTVRYSTRGLQSWNGFTWVSSPWVYSDGKLEIFGGDPPIAALIVGNGGGDIPVAVWMFYGDVADNSNTTQIFNGFADGADSLVDDISLPLYAVSSKGLVSPRFRIVPSNGFNVLPPGGMKMQWGTATIELAPDWGGA
jgi:hypothetical protein